MASYAPMKLVYQELRTAVAPWAKAQGFRRSKGAQAGWQKTINTDQLSVKFEGYTMANSDLGHAWHGSVQLEASGEWTPGSIRQSPFSCCLIQSELDELARIQGAINKRRPPLPSYFKKDFREDTLLGLSLREMYDPSPEYREGHQIEFEYYSIEDVRDLVTFIAAVLPGAVDRFLAGRVAKPVDTTPPHLKPAWLRRMEKP